jgi:PAS domain-containing protein
VDAQLTAYVTLVSTSGVLNLFLCLYVYFKRHQYPNIATFFILNTAATTIYCFGYAFSLTSTTMEQLKLWNIVQYCGMPFAPAFGLLFVMQYLGITITKVRAAALLVIPTLSLLFDATNEFHHLLYRSYVIDATLGAPYLYKEYGIWFVIHGIYLFCCMLTAFILLLSRWKETSSAYRPQLLALMCGQALPMITAFLYLINVTPVGIDPVPMVIWVSSVMFLWSIHSSRMMSILPIAKETIFNSINDGVIVLDESHRLIDYNLACQHMLPALQRTMYGQNMEDLWKMFFSDSAPLVLAEMKATTDLPLTINGTELIYVSPPSHKGASVEGYCSFSLI